MRDRAEKGASEKVYRAANKRVAKLIRQHDKHAK
jgi:hypothetical protein